MAMMQGQCCDVVALCRNEHYYAGPGPRGEGVHLPSVAYGDKSKSRSLTITLTLTLDPDPRPSIFRPVLWFDHHSLVLFLTM